MEKQVVYTFPGTTDTVTLTIGTASALDYARYEALRWEGNRWFNDLTGFNSWETPEERTPEQQQAVDVMDIAIHRCYMLPCLKRVEWSGEPVMDLANMSLEAFAVEVPAGLYARWKAAVLTVNPKTFWPDASEAGNA